MEFIPYSHQYIDDNDIGVVVDVLRSDWLTQGPKVKKFEETLCKYTGAKYAVAVSSGTAALHIACLAAGIKEGDEVITSPITFVASANAVVYCSARPIFADVQADTINIDPEEIKRKITKRTKAIIPVDFAGHPADLAEIREIALKSNLIVIEDAAHALGAEYKGSKIGSCEYSDMTIFSFHPVKHITTGEGGAITTNSDELYKKLCIFRDHGIVRDRGILNRSDEPWYYEQRYLGFNYRITDIQCALGVSQMQRLGEFLRRRKEIAGIYNRELLNIDKISLPVERSYVSSSWHIYCIRVKNHSRRKEVFNKLRKSNVGVQVHYIPVHLQPYYRDSFGYKKSDYPKAESYYSETITLPLHPSIKAEDIDRIINSLKESLL